jgi:hypothetical protein
MARDEDEGATATIEEGNIWFLVRPRVEHHEPSGAEDVQNLYVVLSPHGTRSYRLAIVGAQRLPETHDSGRDKLWGFISGVYDDPRELARDLTEETYQTKTRGERHRPAARPVGEGAYELVRHDGHTHLVYALELPREPGDVQEAFNIESEASYLITVKNPEQPSPPGAGLPRQRKAEYPAKLRERFRGRRFADVDPSDFLDYEGTQFVLVGASDQLERDLGETREPASAKIFRQLRLRKSEHPVEPLFEGRWA